MQSIYRGKLEMERGNKNNTFPTDSTKIVGGPPQFSLHLDLFMSFLIIILMIISGVD